VGLRKLFLILFFLGLLCTGCTSKQSVTYQQAMREKMSRFLPSADRFFAAEFRRAKMAYPPKQLALLIFKRNLDLQLYAKNQGAWHFIKSFPVLAESGGPGPKLHVGDRQVPEGIYQIIGLNPRSRFDLSIHLDYPNAFDREKAKLDDRQNLGGNIFIHGKNTSIGCVAIGNTAIEQLFPLVAKVGIANVKVIIAPGDMRKFPPVYGKVHPVWLTQLYHSITVALRDFPLPKRFGYTPVLHKKSAANAKTASLGYRSTT